MQNYHLLVAPPRPCLHQSDGIQRDVWQKTRGHPNFGPCRCLLPTLFVLKLKSTQDAAISFIAVLRTNCTYNTVTGGIVTEDAENDARSENYRKGQDRLCYSPWSLNCPSESVYQPASSQNFERAYQVAARTKRIYDDDVQ